MANLFSALYDDATLWEDPNPDYAALLGAAGGGGCAADRNACAASIVAAAVRSPISVAFVLQDDPEYIYVGHSPTFYPPSISHPTAFDGRVVILIGDEDHLTTPLILEAAAFTKTNVTANSTAVLTGPAVHGTHPRPLRTGPHSSGDVDTNDHQIRPVMLLPCDITARALRTAPTGRYSLPAFYQHFIEIPMSGSVDEQAKFSPLRDWWCAACTQTAGGDPTIRVAQVLPRNPGETRQLTAWANRNIRSNMARLGVGGPQLSNAAFARGVADLQTTLTDHHNATLDFERDRANKTFTDKHGDALAQRVHRYCGVARDLDLPEVHNLLLKTAKAQAHAVLYSLFQERAAASPVLLSEINAPLATTKLVDEVFRSYSPGGSGLSFGKGLTPFAIICDGHAEAQTAQELIKKAAIVESGGSISLSDATSLVTSDVRFPTEPYIAVEKLYGWSVVVDVFHGPAHPISGSIRRAVCDICPCLHRIATQMSENPAVGMDQICRIMFEFQQDYFQYLTLLGAGAAAPVPDFSDIRQKAMTFRADGLSPLPMQWYSLVSAPSRRGATRETGPREQAGAVSAFNSDADRRLLQRFRESEFSSIAAMMKDRDVEIPKVGDKPICLTWALKGSCSTACKRKNMHVRYSRQVNQKLHQLMDACGVANAQP